MVFSLNGKVLHVGAHEAALTLSDFLRVHLRLTGTKIVCAEGDCGACTVLRAFAPASDEPDFKAINSCVVTTAQMDGSHLVTVDALKDTTKANPLTPVQNAMVTCHGSQCGFCTPGFVMALTAAVESARARGKTELSVQDAKNALTGNLCRCTGYAPILAAAASIRVADCEPLARRFLAPAVVKAVREATRKAVKLNSPEFQFFAPTTLKSASDFFKTHKGARVIGAATDLGVARNKWRTTLDSLLSLHLIPDLYRVQITAKNRVTVGARVTLASLRQALKTKIPEFAHFLDLFASPQIKNFATLVGNIANASPIADTPPFLLVAGATVHALGPKGAREIPIDRFFQGYRQTALKPGEFITAISFDVPSMKESLKLYKVSSRKDLDISAVNAAFRVQWEDRSARKIRQVRLAMGGVAAMPLRLYKTEGLLKGQVLTEDLITRAAEVLATEMTPLSDLRGSSAYRRVVVENLFRKFWEAP